MKKISFLLFIILLQSSFACTLQKTFNEIYKKHYNMAMKKDMHSYKSLRTKNAINEIQMQGEYFKKKNQNYTFMELVNNSVSSDPLFNDLKVLECVVKNNRARVVYKALEEKGRTELLIIIFVKEENTWKMGVYSSSEIKTENIASFIKNINVHPYFKEYKI